MRACVCVCVCVCVCMRGVCVWVSAVTESSSDRSMVMSAMMEAMVVVERGIEANVCSVTSYCNDRPLVP